MFHKFDRGRVIGYCWHAQAEKADMPAKLVRPELIETQTVIAATETLQSGTQSEAKSACVASGNGEAIMIQVKLQFLCIRN